MQAAIYRGPSDIRIEETSDPELEKLTDAIVRITHTAICGSDLWFYRGHRDYEEGAPVGHEPMGIVEEVVTMSVRSSPATVCSRRSRSAVGSVNSVGKDSTRRVPTATAGAVTTVAHRGRKSVHPTLTGRSSASPTSTPTTKPSSNPSCR